MLIRIKNRYKAFANDTTFHGFPELKNAKQLKWKLFWFVIVSAAFAITTFQVYRTVFQYLSQPSTTLILPVKREDILYPDVKVCLTHWIYWIDWKKAFSMNFTKATVIYGMSFIGVAYSSMVFNVDEIKHAFEEQMRMNNFTRISDLYRNIARNFPLTDLKTTQLIEASPYFRDIELLYKRDWGVMMCYKTSAEVMSKNFSKYANYAQVFSFGIQDQLYALFSSYLTAEEYHNYLAVWFDGYSNYNVRRLSEASDLKGISLPLIILPDPFSDDATEIVFDNDYYKIKMDVSAHKWKNMKERQCKENMKQLITNNTEYMLCDASLHVKSCPCPKIHKAVFIKHDTLNNLCSNAIIFLNASSKTNSIKSASKPLCNKTGNLKEYDDCLKQIVNPCEVWRYSSTATISKVDGLVRQFYLKNVTEIYLNYPLEEQNLLMIEVDSQTWEDFIGNIGGVLGIWTGASLLSFIQMFYLCCRNENETQSLDKNEKKTKIIDSIRFHV